MGKFDGLLKRKSNSFQGYKFKATVNLAISRLAVLKNQRKVRSSISRSDVLQLLNNGLHERALLRVELVIKEQNMLDAYVMMESYCDMLIERLHQIEQEKTCPEEIKEAASSLIYASTRCGEFPELLEIRATLASHFGKDFVARASELRNNCGVNTKIIQKLSTRMPSLENRLKVLKDIASENNIVLQLQEVDLPEDKIKQAETNLYTTTNIGDSKMAIFLQAAAELETVGGVTDKKRYKNVADAAQAAFESAAYAAEAARAAVELSRADSHDPDNHNPISSNLQSRYSLSNHEESAKVKSNIEEEKDSFIGIQSQEIKIVYEKIHPVENNASESDKQGIVSENTVEEFKQENNETENYMRSLSTSSSESEENKGLNEIDVALDEDLLKKLEEKELVFDESEDETLSNQGLGSGIQQKVPEISVLDDEKTYNKENEVTETKPYSPAHRFFHFGSRTGAKTDKASDNSEHCFTSKFRGLREDLVSKDRVPISVRTRKTFGW